MISMFFILFSCIYFTIFSSISISSAKLRSFVRFIGKFLIESFSSHSNFSTGTIFVSKFSCKTAKIYSINVNKISKKTKEKCFKYIKKDPIKRKKITEKYLTSFFLINQSKYLKEISFSQVRNHQIKVNSSKTIIKINTVQLLYFSKNK